jgi:hypothetical protein
VGVCDIEEGEGVDAIKYEYCISFNYTVDALHTVFIVNQSEFIIVNVWIELWFVVEIVDGNYTSAKIKFQVPPHSSTAYNLQCIHIYSNTSNQPRTHLQPPVSIFGPRERHILNRVGVSSNLYHPKKRGNVFIVAYLFARFFNCLQFVLQ